MNNCAEADQTNLDDVINRIISARFRSELSEIENYTSTIREYKHEVLRLNETITRLSGGPQGDRSQMFHNIIMRERGERAEIAERFKVSESAKHFFIMFLKALKCKIIKLRSKL